MDYLKRITGLMVILISTTFYGYAQQKGEITLRGTVSAAEEPGNLSHASVIILNIKDSSVITGKNTDEKGYFSIQLDKDRDSVLMKVTHLGFQDLYRSLYLNPARKELYLGKITLSPSSNKLSEFTVSAEKKPMYEYKKDSTIFNVPEDFQPGGSVQDVLEFTPTLTVDDDGNITVEGEGNVGFYVDGKPMSDLGLSVSDYLKNTPAFMVEKVEILDTPPDPEDAAKALAAGVIGKHYINIITRKIKFKGYNAELTTGFNTHHTRTLRMLANINLDPLKIDYYNNFRNSVDSGYLQRTSFGKKPEDSSLLTQNSVKKNRAMNHNLNAQYTFKFSENEELRMNGRVGWNGNRNDKNDFNHIAHPLKTKDETRIQQSENRTDGYNFNGDFDYKKKYDKEGKELTASMNIRQNRNANHRFSTDQYLMKGDSLFQKNKGFNLSRGLRARIQYKNNFGPEEKHFFLLNGSFSTNTGHNLNEVHKTDTTSPERELAPDKNLSSDYFNKGTNYGTFLMIGKRDEKLGWVLATNIGENKTGNHDDYRGSRVSNHVLSFRNSIGMNFSPHKDQMVNLNLNPGYRTYHQNTLPNDTMDLIRYRYNNFIPGGSVKYRLKDHQLSFGYNKDLQMPSWWQLNPFVDNSDPLNLSTGNPELRPSFTNRYRIRYEYRYKMFYATMNLVNRVSKDVITSNKTIDEKGVSTRTFINLNKETRKSAQLNAGMHYFKNFDWKGILNLNVEGALSAYNTSSPDEHVSKEFQDVSGITNTFKLWSSFKYESFTLIINGNYSGPRYFSQGKRPASFRSGLRARASFWNHTLNVNLGVDNLFGASVRNNFYKTDNYIQYNYGRKDVRAFSLFVTYEFKHFQKQDKAG